MPSTVHTRSPILEGLQSLNAWRQQVVLSLRALAELAGELGLLPGGSILRIENLAFEITQDSLRLAVVGEFSRGKSELINALLFADQGQRFLPSGSGQTTMCPVEIRGAPQGRPGLQLLPIASRSIDVSVEKLKRAGSAWVRMPLDAALSGERGAPLKALTETVCVAVEDARRLGLCPPLNQTPRDRERTVCPSCGLGKVLIPRWRHAVFYLPHPMLDAGLTVLDTPGLNAIGAEPELTFSMLADADAILFLLGIDTGVTQSDMTIWEQYLKRVGLRSQLVLLNKVDTLWDELRDPEETEQEIGMQAEKTAQRLGVKRDQVIPLSGHKALVARVRGNEELLDRSGIRVLESAIASLLIPGRRESLQAKSRLVADKAIADQKSLLRNQMEHLRMQIQDMQQLRERTSEKVPRLIAQHRQKLEQFETDRRIFESRKTAFQEAAREYLLSPLSTEAFDLLISNAKGEMLSAWTTAGIVERFRSFFAEAISHFDSALTGAARVNVQIASEYQVLQSRYHLPALGTVPYAIMPRRAELLSMSENYERFGMMLEIAVNTQSAVVRKAFLAVAGKVRDFIVETRRDAEFWVDEIMGVMNQHLELYHQKAGEELESLEKISQAMGNIEIRIHQLENQLARLRGQMERVEMCEKRLAAVLGSGQA